MNFHIIFYAWCFGSGIAFGVLGKLWRLPFWFTAAVITVTNTIIGLIVL